MFPGDAATQQADFFCAKIGRLALALESERKAQARILGVLRLLKEGELTLDDLIVTETGWELKSSPNGQE